MWVSFAGKIWVSFASRERSRREVEQVGRCSEAKARAVAARGRLKKKHCGQPLY